MWSVDFLSLASMPLYSYFKETTNQPLLPRPRLQIEEAANKSMARVLSATTGAKKKKREKAPIRPVTKKLVRLILVRPDHYLLSVRTSFNIKTGPLALKMVHIINCPI